MDGSFKRPEVQGNSHPTAQDFVKALFDDVSEESFTNSFNVNTVGPYWLTISFLPLLEKWKNQRTNGIANGGRGFVPQVITTSSINGWTKVSHMLRSCSSANPDFI